MLLEKIKTLGTYLKKFDRELRECYLGYVGSNPTIFTKLIKITRGYAGTGRQACLRSKRVNPVRVRVPLSPQKIANFY